MIKVNDLKETLILTNRIIVVKDDKELHYVAWPDDNDYRLENQVDNYDLFKNHGEEFVIGLITKSDVLYVILS